MQIHPEVILSFYLWISDSTLFTLTPVYGSISEYALTFNIIVGLMYSEMNCLYFSGIPISIRTT